MFRAPAGLPFFLKDGASHYKGADEAFHRNVEAAKRLGDTLKTSYGPCGMNKLINNFIQKRFLTSDGFTVISELEVQHPAAKTLVLAAQMQHTEFGDHASYVIIFAAELLAQAGELVRSGVHNAFVVKGYKLALTKCLELMAGLASNETIARTDLIKPVVATKLSGLEHVGIVVRLVDTACSAVMAADAKHHLDSDNVRVAKITGGSLESSEVLDGMVLMREPKTECKEKRDVKVILLGTPLEGVQTEASSTVLIKETADLLSFTKDEEKEMEELIKGWHDAGIEAVICGGSISALALHFLNQYEMWCVACPSKFDIKRLSRTLRTPALQRRGQPLAEEIGKASFLGVQEFGSQLVTVVRAQDTRVSTILLRGPTAPFLDECERAIDNSVALLRAFEKDDRHLVGGGAFEMALSQQLEAYADTLSGLEQYAVQRFGQALTVFPKILAENAGQNALDLEAQLVAAHQEGKSTFGVDVTSSSGVLIRDTNAAVAAPGEWQPFSHLGMKVADHYLTKQWALRLAADAALTLLRVDQIIMSKPAGGPKLPNQGHWDEADDRAGFQQ